MSRLANPAMADMHPSGGVPGIPLAMQTQHMAPVPPPGMAAQSQEAQSAAEFTHCRQHIVLSAYQTPLIYLHFASAILQCVQLSATASKHFRLL